MNVNVSYYPLPLDNEGARKPVQEMLDWALRGYRVRDVIPVGPGSYVIWIQEAPDE